MRIYYFLQAFVCLIAVSESRGPHHPRGHVVKRHVHYRPTKGFGEEKLIQDDNLLHDKEHIQEHLEEVVKEPDLSNMTDEQLEFYYFQFHDVDKNNKLDGLEILQALFHIDHHELEGAGDGTDDVEHNDEDSSKYYVDLIDDVLKEDDTDGDGFLSYPEYVAGRQKKKSSDIKTANTKLI